MNSLTILAMLACCVAAAMAYPNPYPEAYAEPDDAYAPKIHKGYHDDHHHGYKETGRVKIQVYRGPSVHKGKHGYEDIYFAPWGYYVTQPEDAKKKKHHY